MKWTSLGKFLLPTCTQIIPVHGERDRKRML